MATVPDEAKAALERLKTLIVPGTGGVDAAELIRLADLAASPITDTAAREKLSESLIAALTVLSFGPFSAVTSKPRDAGVWCVQGVRATGLK